MLGKLIKYDFKANAKLMLILNLAIVIAGFFGGRFIIPNMDKVDSRIIGIVVIFYILLIVAVGFAVPFIIVSYYYRSFFTERGYLSFTLPVSKGQHLLSKSISGVVWLIVSGLAIIVSLWLLCSTEMANAGLTWKMIGKNLNYIAEEVEMSSPVMISVMFILIVLSAIVTCGSLYFSATLGQMARTHKIIAGVGSYFVYNFISSTISQVGIVFLVRSNINNIYQGVKTSQVFQQVLWLTFMIQIAAVIVMYLISWYVLNKKVNLQ